MRNTASPIAYYVIVTFLALSTVLMLISQTTPVFGYDLAVRLGFQKGADQITEVGVQTIRAFCVSDTVVFIPLTVLGLVGLLMKKRWAFYPTAAASGISIYWAIAYGLMVTNLQGTPGFHAVLEGPDWVIMGAYVGFGVWSLLYLMFRGERLLAKRV
jgi:hypothetical protein